MDVQVRVGVIGAGAMGTSHVAHAGPLGAGCPGRRAVFDADVARAKDVADEVGADASRVGRGADRVPTTSTRS